MTKMTDLQAQRIAVRDSLWNNRIHQKPSTDNDSFDRVQVLSPSLANCLRQRTTQDRTVLLYAGPKPESVTEALEKLTYDVLYEFDLNFKEALKRWKPTIEAAQPYLRSSVIEKPFEGVFLRSQASQPRLRSIVIYDDPHPHARLFNTKVIHKFGAQLQSFAYSGARPYKVISTVAAMSRLKKLKMKPLKPFTGRTVQPSIEHIIPWHQLSHFSLQCDVKTIFGCAPLFGQLGQMTQLRKLSIGLTFEMFRPEVFPKTKEIKEFLTENLSKIPVFSKLEVLSVGVQASKELDPTLDYRFLLGLLVPKLGATLTKLIFRMPYTFESSSDCIFLDYSNDFPHLQTLVLDYGPTTRMFGIPSPKLYDGEDKRTPSQSIRHLTMTNFNESHLLFDIILPQIPAIFPNLVELNFKFAGRSSFPKSLADGDLMAMISRLPHLGTLRFMDNYPKVKRLLCSIELMCRRAAELKPKEPMLFRLPLGDDFELLKYAADQVSDDKMKQNFYCWDKADKWIRIC